ncbi:MAG: hypothetical protein SGPRY_010391, partial [Prymnesium sp.]
PWVWPIARVPPNESPTATVGSSRLVADALAWPGVEHNDPSQRCDGRARGVVLCCGGPRRGGFAKAPRGDLASYGRCAPPRAYTCYWSVQLQCATPR